MSWAPPSSDLPPTHATAGCSCVPSVIYYFHIFRLWWWLESWSRTESRARPVWHDLNVTTFLSALRPFSGGSTLGDRTVTGFPGVGVAGLLTGLHRCTLFAPTISLLQVYLQDIVKDGSEVLAIWIALPIFSQFHSGPGFRKEDQMGSNTMKGQKETEGNVMIRNIRNTRNSKKHGLWQLVMWHP